MDSMGLVSFHNNEGKRESGRGGTNLWHSADRERFNRLHDAAKGIYAHAPDAAVPVPAPVPVPMGWDSVDTSTPETPAPQAIETLANATLLDSKLTDAEVETLATDAAPDAPVF